MTSAFIKAVQELFEMVFERPALPILIIALVADGAEVEIVAVHRP